MRSIRRRFPVVLVFLLAAGATSAAWGSAAVEAAPPEVAADWRRQDGIDSGRSPREVITAVLVELGSDGAVLRAALEGLDGVSASDPRWDELYLQACARRRSGRLRTLLAGMPRIIFTKHYDLGGSFYAYTEGQSDAQNERQFVPGASLCLLTMKGLYGEVETLLDEPEGVIRDPDVSWDGRRVLFSWKKSDREDDYHLYEMDLAEGQSRQLTFGLGFADYEGVYAPNGDLIFNSTRGVQTVDCWWTEVSNLYTCDRDGRYLRRLTFDQVHDNYPTVAPDGRILYTRWDYNDRGQIYPQGLFQMYPDGTGQTEVYGNNSWFPTSILHARAIPGAGGGLKGSGRIVAIFSGHHTLQKGWLGLLDPAKGRQENAGAQLIAPVRATEAVRVDGYGQEGDQFQYPYPLGETEFLVGFKPGGVEVPFGIYWLDVDGRRELLAWDGAISCNQPVPLVARPVPHVRPSAVDYRQSEGVFFLQDVYAGQGLAGIPRGTVKKLRVVALEYRAAGIAHNCNRGPAGEALVCTPVSIGNGSWDTKTVLGEARVYEDGSAMFAVPARTPVYFQAVDDRGYVVQTMRSWSTLQPGERLGCVGCHESKNSVAGARASGASAAIKAGLERLTGFYGPPRGFSYRKEIQPILDRHCVGCHNLASPAPWRGEFSSGMDEGSGAADDLAKRAFSLRGDEILDATAKRKWAESYLALTRIKPQSTLDCVDTWAGQPSDLVNWVSAQSEPSMLPPYSAGAARSGLMTLLEEGHNGVQLSREERDKIACWIDLLVPFCGDYLEANAWSDEEVAKYRHFLAKRKGMQEEEQRNIAEWIAARERPTVRQRDESRIRGMGGMRGR
ncbi:MAG TPA: hypothetical protein PKY77_16205 [Phycisphaerae bacterium]|nr:hypothetical protein [Phycisphaerae bacterium]HRY70800.1 hypothetical protein [Phycisphaerae bacterium]HSA29218.1 hypothetical protein [Phycisphaerae bacterium]